MRKIKIAFLIMAHNNPNLLNTFVKQLLSYEESYVFIHVDKSSLLSKDDIIIDDRVIVLDNNISVSWGDYTLIQAAEILIDYAYNYSDFDYYSFHSGVDLMIKPISEFIEYLQDNGKDAYIECEKLPIKNFDHCGGLERIGLHYPKYMRKKAPMKSFTRYSRAIYMCLYKFKINKIKDNIYYFGSVFFTASNKLIKEYYLFLKNHTDFKERFVHSLCADEIYFNTIFMNSQNCNISSRNNLFFIKWNEAGENAGSPKTLTYDDKDEMLNSGKFFARKFDDKIDKEIITYLTKEL